MKPKSPPKPKLLPSRLDVFSFIRDLHQPGEVAELQLFKANKNGKIYRVYFGFFDDLSRLAEAAVILNHSEKQSVFVTLNPLCPREGVDNRIYVSNAQLQRTIEAEGQPLASRMRESKFIKKSKNGKINKIILWKALHTVEEDIARRKWVLVDIDAGQPSGMSSTDTEKSDAQKMANAVIDELNDQGVHASLVDSGNGYHVYFPIDRPNDDASKSLVKQILQSLSLKFGGKFGLAKIDTTVFDAKRVTKVAGTVVYKGQPTEDRPHRRSQVLIWDARATATQEQLQSLVSAEAKEATEPAGRSEQPRVNRNLDNLIAASSEAVAKKLTAVEKFLKFHGILIYSTDEDTKKITLTVRCPNAKEHTTAGKTAVIFVNKHAKKTAQNDGVSLGFSCQHDHCRALKGWKNFQKFCDTRKPGGWLGASPRWERQARRQALKQELTQEMNAAGVVGDVNRIVFDMSAPMVFDYSKKAMVEFLLSKEPTVEETKARADELGFSRRKLVALRCELGIVEKKIKGVWHYVKAEVKARAKAETSPAAQREFYSV
jgi:hypothetical protein